MSAAEPERMDSEPPAPATPAEPAAPAAPVTSSARPDWLVGAEEGVTAEHGRLDKPTETRPVLKMATPSTHDGQDLPIPQLDLGGPEAGAPTTRLTLLRPGQPSGSTESSGQTAAAPEPRRAWTAASSSIPTLRREASPPARIGESERREFNAPEDRSEMPDLPDDLPIVQPVVGLPRLREAWWLVALEEARANRGLQIAVALLLMAFATFELWPRREPTVSISYLQHHAQEFDGRAVTVRGRVGDIFPAGGGYTFYLRQGGETIVVFTRTRVPVMNQTLSVKGTISTGYLDGSPHQSLFENP